MSIIISIPIFAIELPTSAEVDGQLTNIKIILQNSYYSTTVLFLFLYFSKTLSYDPFLYFATTSDESVNNGETIWYKQWHSYLYIGFSVIGGVLVLIIYISIRRYQKRPKYDAHKKTEHKERLLTDSYIEMNTNSQ